MKKVFLLFLLVGINVQAQRGGDHGNDWIEIAYFDYAGSSYASARSDEAGVGCFLNLQSDPSHFASLHRNADQLTIDTVGTASVTFQMIGSFASAFDSEIDMLYRRVGTEYRGVSSSESIVSQLNLDQNCALAGFIGSNAPVGSSPVTLDNIILEGTPTTIRIAGIYQSSSRYDYSSLDTFTNIGDRTELPNIGQDLRASHVKISSGGKEVLAYIVDRNGTSHVLQIVDTNYIGGWNIGYAYSGYNVTIQFGHTGLDSDGDGAIDYNDPFPNDPTETLDTDMDGIGDNADHLPLANVGTAITTLLGTVDSVYQGNFRVVGDITGELTEEFTLGSSNSPYTVVARLNGTFTNPQGQTTTSFTRVSGQYYWDLFLNDINSSNVRIYRITPRPTN